VGELVIVHGTSRSERRRLVAASCEEATEALSLVAALAFDPGARQLEEPRPRPTKGRGSPSAFATPAEPATPRAGAEGPKNGAEAAPAPTDPSTTDLSKVERPRPKEEAEAPPSRPAARPSATSWRWAAAANGGVRAVGTSSATFSYGGFLELENEQPGLSPSFRLGAMRAESSAAGHGASGDLVWTLGHASVCPARLDLLSAVSARPCAGIDAGLLSAQAVGLPTSRERTRPWIAPNVAGRLRAGLGRFVFLEIQGGVAVPLVRDELVVDPAVSVYRAPAVAPFGEIAAGARFP
jgi:hypothetical protein